MTRKRYLRHVGIMFVSYLVSLIFFGFMEKNGVISPGLFYLICIISAAFIIFYFGGITLYRIIKSLFWNRILFTVAYCVSFSGIVYKALALITSFSFGG